MKQVILVGTSHPIQEGQIKSKKFESYINELCSSYSIKRIAEETRDYGVTVGYDIAEELGIDYIVIEPKPEDYESLGIEHIHEIQWSIQQKSGLMPPPEMENLSPELKIEYDIRFKKHMQDREKVWLQKILEKNVYPTLVTCGADHFKSFSNLLKEHGIEVLEEEARWGLD